MTSHLEEGVLQELLDGEIPSSELAPIQAHLAHCAECRARLDEARALGAEADRLIETIDLAEAPLRVGSRAQPPRPRVWIRNAAWAATVVIAAGTGYLARSTDSPKEQLPVPPAEEAKTAPAAASPRADTTPPALDQPTPVPVREKGAPRGKVSGGVKPERSAVASEVRREPASSLTTTAALEKSSARRDTALALNEIVTRGVADAARPAAPSQAGGVTAQKALALRAAPAAETVNRLDEMTVVGAADKRAPHPVEITFPEALRRLDGSLRLIEGLVPLRLEVLGVDVRVVYPLGSGELLLAQRLENGRLTYRLQAPPGFPADSLERLRARVHD